MNGRDVPRALALVLAAAACAQPPVPSPVSPTSEATSDATSDARPARIECPPGRGDCDRDPANGCEVDLANDADDCHVCGHSCQGAHATEGCFDGVCRILRCEPRYGDCDHLAENGCETRLCYSSGGWSCKPEGCGGYTF